MVYSTQRDFIKNEQLMKFAVILNGESLKGLVWEKITLIQTSQNPKCSLHRKRLCKLLFTILQVLHTSKWAGRDVYHIDKTVAGGQLLSTFYSFSNYAWLD